MATLRSRSRGVSAARRTTWRSEARCRRRRVARRDSLTAAGQALARRRDQSADLERECRGEQNRILERSSLAAERPLDEAPLVTNQVEFHPLLNQDILLEAAIETDIPLSSYASVARGAIFNHPPLDEVAQGYGKSAAQVALRWILQKGVAINTMTVRITRTARNSVMEYPFIRRLEILIRRYLVFASA